MRRFFIWILCLSLLVLPVRAAAPPKYAALTFDDGPSGRFTRQLLKGLQERDVQATFFLCGYRMAQDPELTHRIHCLGHEIGCHGYTHKNMDTLSRRDIAGEIEAMEKLLPQGCQMAFLRPPEGLCSQGVQQVAAARNLAILRWSVDPRDWESREAAAIKKAVLSRVKDGDVILLHDMTESSVQAALEIVDALKARGFRLVTVSKLAQLRQAAIHPGMCYTAFPPRT